MAVNYRSNLKLEKLGVKLLRYITVVNYHGIFITLAPVGSIYITLFTL